MVIAVAGATGNVGGALARILAADGHEVRAIVRRAGGRTWPEGVVEVVGDLADGAGLRDAFAGADGAFLLSGYDDAGLVAALREGRVPRVALLSSSSAPTGDLGNAVAAYHLRSEQALRDSAGMDLPAPELLHDQRARVGGGDPRRSARRGAVR